MANKYESFAAFMAVVVNDSKHRIESGTYGEAWGLVASILEKVGWVGFCVICGLLALGAIAFGVSLPVFLASPVGLIIVALGGGAIMWKLWRNKKLPLAVKKVGDYYKSQYESAAGDHYKIDQLQDRVANALCCELLGRPW